MATPAFVVQPRSKRGRGKRARGVTVGPAPHVLRIRIDQYTGPPRRQYLGVAGKSIRLVVDDADERDRLFEALVTFLGRRTWRK